MCLKNLTIKCFNVHLQVIIMGGRSNKLCVQKGQDTKGARKAKKPTKRNLALAQKNHIKRIWSAKKQLNLNNKR